MQKHKRILICPLDWGLGHASRCIPIIRLLLEKNADVLIAADGRPMALLKQEFPELTFIQFKGYGITYPEKGSMNLKMLFSIPGILKGIKEENKELDKIIEKHKIDIVISDNRYGCHSKEAKSVFITHQLMIKTPFGESLLHKKVLSYISKYDECWVPDNASIKLSGDLAHKFPLPANTFFIGPLSRFKLPVHKTTSSNQNTPHSPLPTPESRLMAIISGPEPQRSIFEKMLIEALTQTNLKALVVRGKTESQQGAETKNNIQTVNHLSSSEMQKAIEASSIILSRSGYSTVMDLAVLGKKVIFVPTPGQTEQEYLGKLFKDQGIAFSVSQSEFDLTKALEQSEKYKGFEKTEIGNELEKRIDLILSAS